MKFLRERIRMDRHELGGAFGDIGTDLPLIAGMILVSGMDAASVLILFGAAQLFTALYYGIPMPVQPLKVVAALVITQQLPAALVYGAGLAIGATMLVLTLTGLVSRMGAIVPRPIILGLQVGLGLKLIEVAIGYATNDGVQGGVLACAGAALILLLYRNRHVPPALLVIGLGMAYAFLSGAASLSAIAGAAGFAFPRLYTPAATDIIQGFLLLGLAQIPVSLGNSIFATGQLANDLFPHRNISTRQIGLSYSLMNLIAPFFSGIPMCHGSGGMLGMHFFGARTGGAPLLYGLFFLGLGCFFSGGFSGIVAAFPLPILGVLLFFEGFALTRRLTETLPDRVALFNAATVGIASILLPYGFLFSMIFGTIAWHLTAFTWKLIQILRYNNI